MIGSLYAQGAGGELAKRKKAEVDILAHVLLPPMKILSEKEKNELLKKYKIDQTQLPKIRKNDPAAVALKAKVGDVIRIERNDGTGKYYAYRVVIE